MGLKTSQNHPVLVTSGERSPYFKTRPSNGWPVLVADDFHVPSASRWRVVGGSLEVGLFRGLVAL